MEKRISFFHFQSVKAVAKAINPHLRTLESIKKDVMSTKNEYEKKKVELKARYDKKFAELKEKYDESKTQIDALEAGILQVTGLHVNDLVKKVIEPTGKTDAKGKALTETKYVETDIVKYDKDKKEYVVTVPDTEEEANPGTLEPECPTPETEEESIEEHAAEEEEIPAEDINNPERSNGEGLPWD